MAQNKIKGFIEKKKEQEHEPVVKKDDLKKLGQNTELK